MVQQRMRASRVIAERYVVSVSSERPLAEDTALAAERLQVQVWRRMTPTQKFALLEDLHAAANLFVEAGIRHRYPQAGPEEVRMRRLAMTLGRDLVRRVYGFDVGEGA